MCHNDEWTGFRGTDSKLYRRIKKEDTTMATKKGIVETARVKPQKAAESATRNRAASKKAAVSYEDMLKGFNNIPRMAETGKSIAKNNSQSMKSDKWTDKSDEKTKEKQAVKDMKRLLVLMEKSIIGEISDKELHEITNTGQWLESIAVLKEYIATLEY